MSNVNSFSIHKIMRNLRKHRSIFHSEADFQHALAWQIHTDFPDCQIRLEYKPISSVNMFVDIWVWIGDIQIAIEVKYPAAKHIIKLQDLFETFHLDKGGPLVHLGTRNWSYQFNLRLSLRHDFSRNPEGFKPSLCMSDGNLYAPRLTPRCTSASRQKKLVISI